MPVETIIKAIIALMPVTILVIDNSATLISAANMLELCGLRHHFEFKNTQLAQALRLLGQLAIVPCGYGSPETPALG